MADTNKAIEEVAMTAQQAVDIAKQAQTAQETKAMEEAAPGPYVPEKIEPGGFGRPFHIITGNSNEHVPQVPYSESPMVRRCGG